MSENQQEAGPTQLEKVRLLEELERLLSHPGIPDDAKEALRNHELVLHLKSGMEGRTW